VKQFKVLISQTNKEGILNKTT